MACRRSAMASLTNSGVSYMATWVAPSTMCRLLSRLPARLKASWLNHNDPALLPARYMAPRLIALTVPTALMRLSVMAALMAQKLCGWEIRDEGSGAA
jgi:hypothetical protein